MKPGVIRSLEPIHERQTSGKLPFGDVLELEPAAQFGEKLDSVLAAGNVVAGAHDGRPVVSDLRLADVAQLPGHLPRRGDGGVDGAAQAEVQRHRGRALNVTVKRSIFGCNSNKHKIILS